VQLVAKMNWLDFEVKGQGHNKHLIWLFDNAAFQRRLLVDGLPSQNHLVNSHMITRNFKCLNSHLLGLLFALITLVWSPLFLVVEVKEGCSQNSQIRDSFQPLLEFVIPHGRYMGEWVLHWKDGTAAQRKSTIWKVVLKWYVRYHFKRIVSYISAEFLCYCYSSGLWTSAAGSVYIWV